MQSACPIHQWGMVAKAARAETALDAEAAETAKSAEAANDMAARYRRIGTSSEGTWREPFSLVVGSSGPRGRPVDNVGLGPREGAQP